jgi:UDP-glucose 4-epimerase
MNTTIDNITNTDNFSTRYGIDLARAQVLALSALKAGTQHTAYNLVTEKACSENKCDLSPIVSNVQDKSSCL